MAFVLMPFGLSGLALGPMGWGIEAVITIAETVQAMPGAVTYMPAMPVWGFALLSLGGLWLCLWRLPWRAIGLCPIVIGVAAIALVRTPDILVSETGKLTAVKGNDGRLLFQSRAHGFVAETWLRRAGLSPSTTGSLKGPATGDVQCDTIGCIVRTRGEVIALVKNAAALPDDCAVATIIVSRVPVRDKHCIGPKIIIDRFDQWRAGAHALWLTPEGIQMKTVAGTSGRRPWSLYPRGRRQN